MSGVEQLAATIALTLGVGWASGINLYAAVLTLGLMQTFGYVDLPPELHIVADPIVIAAAGFMYCVEFVADKTPAVDSGWDGLHTFIRLPAGALLAAAAVGDVSPAAQIAAGLVGGTLAAGSHGLKAGGRALINTSPEPVSNWSASVLEDVAVVSGLWVALHYPLAFLAALTIFIGFTIWMLPKVWRGIKRITRFLRGADNSGSPPQPPAPTGPPIRTHLEQGPPR